MNDEQEFWDSIAKEQANRVNQTVEPTLVKKKIKVRVDKNILEKFRKVEEELKYLKEIRLRYCTKFSSK